MLCWLLATPCLRYGRYLPIALLMLASYVVNARLIPALDLLHGKKTAAAGWEFWVGDGRNLTRMMYFMAGVLLRRFRDTPLPAWLALLSLGYWVVDLGFTIATTTPLPHFVRAANTCLLGVACISYCASMRGEALRRDTVWLSFVLWISAQSFGIYLWHAFPILLVRYRIDDPQLGALVVYGGLACVLVGLRVAERWPLLSRWVTGYTRIPA
jgi:peptidoglycan/LPS O-acetylase OafA/YrhL